MSQQLLAEAFLDQVERALTDVADRLGLETGAIRVDGDSQARIEYRGEGATLSVMLDRGEIDAALTPRSDPGEGGDVAEDRPPLQLRLLLGMAGVDRWRSLWPRLVGQATLDRALADLVRALETYAAPWLTGERTDFDRITGFRDADAALRMGRYAPDRRPTDEFKPILEAWDEQDLGEVARLVEALDPPLRDREERALRYARGGG